MQLLDPYDPETFNTDMLELSLPEACDKYKEWVQHKHGAKTFGDLTLYIAMREVVTVEYPDEYMQPFASVEELWHAYNHRLKYELRSMNSELGRLLQRVCFRFGISQRLREFTVTHHAIGYSTAMIINLVLKPGDIGVELTPLNLYAQHYGLMQRCRDYLSRQLNYLTLRSPRFPKKYKALWIQAREAYTEAIHNNIPLTQLVE